MQRKGVFCISLDFELHWGVFDKKSVEENPAYFDQARASVKAMLDLFVDNEIHCTWATVGALAANNQKEQAQCLYEIGATYDQEALRPAKVKVGEDEINDPNHFAQSLIELIEISPYQELASHTYSHFYTLEPGSTHDAFERDLRLAKEALDNPVSLVYPRNQYSQEHLELAYQYGIEVARTNPDNWFWKTEAQTKESLVKKVIRTLDHYFPIASDTSVPFDRLQKHPGQPLLLPASRFLRPPSVIDKLLGKRKVSRICAEMTKAAKNSGVYHLWWHPHNFSVNHDQSMGELKKILDHYNTLKAQYGFQSLSMSELAILDNP